MIEQLRTNDARLKALSEIRAGRAVLCNMPELIFHGPEMKSGGREWPEITITRTEVIAVANYRSILDVIMPENVLAIFDLSDCISGTDGAFPGLEP